MFSLFRIISLLFCVTGCSGGGNSAQAPEVAPPPVTDPLVVVAQPDMDNLRNRVIAWYPIGRSTQNYRTRQIRKQVLDIGWPRFINQVVLPEISGRGLHRVMIHNPFGTLPASVEPMQFDQYLDAKKARLSAATDHFVDGWRPVVNQGTEVISYIGSPVLDDDSQSIIKTKGEAAFLREHADPAIAPFVNAGMSIALDAAALAARDSVTYRLAESLVSRGTPVYIEATPAASDTHWFNSRVIIKDETWVKRKSDPQFAQRSDLAGEIIRIPDLPLNWVRGHSDSAWPVQVCRILADGDSVLIADRLLRSTRRTIEGLADCVAQVKL